MTAVTKANLNNARWQRNAELATGLCHQHMERYHRTVLGAAEAGPSPLTDREARKLFLAGNGIECPGAGAGSVGRFLQSVGMELIRTLDHTSSAGDWCHEARDRKGARYFVSQVNRHPMHGFTYFLEPWEPHHLSWDTV